MPLKILQKYFKGDIVWIIIRLKMQSLKGYGSI